MAIANTVIGVGNVAGRWLAFWNFLKSPIKNFLDFWNFWIFGA